MTLEMIAKALTYAAVLAAIGASTVFWTMLPRLTPDGFEDATSVERTLGRVGFLASVSVSVALVLRAWLHTVTVFGFANSLRSNQLRTVIVDSRWGHAWLWQMCVAVMCAVAYAPTALGSRGAWTIASATSVGVALALTRTGHAAGVPARMTLHTAHIVGGGLWLGTLAILMAIRHVVDQRHRNRLFRAFAPIAITGAVILIFTGVAASYMYVGSLRNLWMTTYGRVLLAKLVLVAAALTCGYINSRAIRGGRQEPGRAATVELLMACSILMATGVLTELEHP